MSKHTVLSRTARWRLSDRAFPTPSACGRLLGVADVLSPPRASSSAAATADMCARPLRRPQTTLDDLLEEEEARRVRVVKVDVEGGEWRVLRGMPRLLEQADVEVVVEVTPKWLALERTSAEELLAHMAANGFHAYVLGEAHSYDVERGCVRAARCEAVDAPRRLGQGESLEALGQADIVFSRRDLEFL